MTSMRKLRRRLLRWDRYAATTGHQRPMRAGTNARLWLRGHCRAWDAVEVERERRDAVLAAWYDVRCCEAGELGHNGPCVWFCSWCSGDGAR